MTSPEMSRKDNVIVWAAIFLPRLMIGAAMVTMCSVPRVNFPFYAGAWAISMVYMGLMVLNIISWANSRLPFKLFDTTSDRSSIDMAIFTASTICTGILVAVARQPSFPYSELVMFLLITSLLVEAGNLYVIPAQWKIDPQLIDSFFQKVYLLVLFTLVFIYFALVMHLLTQGYYKPCMVRMEC